MNPTIQTQLQELKATLEAIRIGISVLEARLDQDAEEPEPTEQERADFNAWCEGFDQRWANRKQDVGCCVPDNAAFKPCGPLCLTHGDVRDTSVRS